MPECHERSSAEDRYPKERPDGCPNDGRDPGDVREELRKTCAASAAQPVADIAVAAAGYKGGHKVAAAASPEGLLDVPMYQIDALVRRAPSLQKTREGRTPAATY